MINEDILFLVGGLFTVIGYLTTYPVKFRCGDQIQYPEEILDKGSVKGFLLVIIGVFLFLASMFFSILNLITRINFPIN